LSTPEIGETVTSHSLQQTASIPFGASINPESGLSQSRRKNTVASRAEAFVYGAIHGADSRSTPAQQETKAPDAFRKSLCFMTFSQDL
jgi:hypothetical protein